MRLPFDALFEQRSVRLTGGFTSVSSLLGHGPTSAGVTVTEETAEGIPTVFACTRVIANACAQLPLKLFRLQEGHKVEAESHPLFSVLHDLANPEMTAFEFRVLLTSQLLLWGNAYAEVERNARGEVVALWPLLPWAMRVDRDDRRRLRFTYHMGTSQKQWIYDPSRPPILRLMIHSVDGLTGRSPVRVLRESVGLTLALQQFGATFYANGSTFGGVLSADRDIDVDQEKQIRSRIEALHQSIDKAHRFLVLGAGFEYARLGIPPEDAQYLESRKFQRGELCGAFGVPPHLIADLDHATFSNVENESLRWLRDGLEPYLCNWESAIRRDLLGPRSFETYYPRFIRNAMVRGDLQSRAAALATMRQNGIVNANEWRALEELDPITAKEGGDVYLVNAASKPTGQTGDVGLRVGKRMTFDRTATGEITGATVVEEELPRALMDELRHTLARLLELEQTARG